jgi:hypothetical protein
VKLTGWLLAASLLAPAVARAEAAPDKKVELREKAARLTLLEQIKKLLPRGWTLETAGLPAGVAGLALGPGSRIGRPVVLVSVLESGTPEEELVDQRARAWMADHVEASPGVESVEPVADGVPGAAEFAAVAPAAGSEERLVRYLIASGKPSYLLTVVAPKSTFEATYRQVVEIATRLRRTTTKE